MSTAWLIFNTVALWVIVFCQVLESKQFSRTRKDFGELIKRNAELGKKNAELGLAFNALDLCIKNLETNISDSDLLKDAIEDLDQVKYELKRIDKTASNNREKIMALQEKNRKQDQFNKDFDRAIKRVGRRR